MDTMNLGAKHFKGGMFKPYTMDDIANTPSVQRLEKSTFKSNVIEA